MNAAPTAAAQDDAEPDPRRTARCEFMLNFAAQRRTC
jgi:hypothetical protein